MTPRRGPTLAERAAFAAAQDAHPTARHCWVVEPPHGSGRCPGLLVEWRRGERGWEGRVAYAVADAGGPVLVEAWLPAWQLEQAAPRP